MTLVPDLFTRRRRGAAFAGVGVALLVGVGLGNVSATAALGSALGGGSSASGR